MKPQNGDVEKKVLIASFIFVLSLAAFIQFGALQWRASLIRESATVKAGAEWVTKGFPELAAFQKLCPDLGGIPKLRSVRFYHRVLQVAARMGAAAWASSEMEICARYATAVLMQQVERNQTLAHEASSF